MRKQIHTTVPAVVKDRKRESFEEFQKQNEKAMQTGKSADVPQTLQGRLEELEDVMEDQALRKAMTPPKVPEPKSTPESPYGNPTTVPTPLTKADK